MVTGLPLNWEDADGSKVFPLAALVILKAVNSDGDEIYAVIPTEDLPEVDALGMAHYAVLYTEDMVRKSINAEIA